MTEKREQNFPEMLTIDQTAERSGLSAYAVRKLARSSEGRAFTVRVGTKYLINWEKFVAYFNGTEPLSQPTAASSAQGTPFGCPSRGANTEEPQNGKIQPVPVQL